MRKLPVTAAEELLEIIMRRYERASTLLTSNRPVEDWVSCSATARPSPLCLTVCCITAMCSSAVHAAGAPKPAAWEKRSDNAKAKPKTIKMPGKERPAASQTRFQTPFPEPHHRNLRKDTKPSTIRLHDRTAEGCSTDSCKPAPASRLWIAPQGATPTEQYKLSTRGVVPRNWTHCSNSLRQGKTSHV